MKKKLARTLSVIVASTMIVSAFAGCSTSKTTSSQQTSPSTSSSKTFANKVLNIAVFQGAYGRDFWDSIASDFMKKYPGTKVNVTSNPKLGDMIKPQIAAGNPPDFIYLNQGESSGVTQSLINDHQLTDLSDVFNGNALDKTTSIKDEILDGILDSSFCKPYSDGKIYLAPYNYGVEGLWYNKTYFDKKGYTVPKTWDEFFALADKAKADGRALFTYQGIYPSYLEEIMVPCLYSAGGDSTVEAFDNYTLDWKSDAATKTLAIFDKISKNNLLMQGTVALNHTQAQTAFMQGKSMFIVNGSWFETEMKDAPRESGFVYGFAGVPAFKEGDTVNALASIEQMYIPSKAKNSELAKEFLRFIYTDDGVKLNGEKAKAVMCVKGAAEKVKSNLTASSYNCYSAVENGMHLVISSLSPVAKGSTLNASDEIYKPISDVMNGQLTVSKWADNLNSVYKQIKSEIKAQQ
jgi:N-acetylglucosamine transport system substrate-binding protein